MITVEELVDLTEQQKKQSSFKLGTVIDLFQNGTAKVKFDGEEEPSKKEYSYLAKYIPSTGDRVLLASVGGTYIILDAIYYNQKPDNSLSENVTTINGRLDSMDQVLAQVNTALDTKISSNLAEDNNGNINISYMYVDPTTKRLYVRRKNGEWSNYAAES